MNASRQQHYMREVGAHIYMTIDISGSMDGVKIDQVSASIQEVFNTTPDHVNFTIQVFNESIHPFFIGNTTATKNIADGIRNMCDGATALYDAVGQLVSNIPSKICSSEIVQLVVLTDGEDNASTHYTHASMTALVKDKSRANPNFTVNFIQVGPQTGVFKSLQNVVPPAESNIMNVANSSAGVKSAMVSVQHNIMMSSNRVNAIRSGGTSQVGPPVTPLNRMPTIQSGVGTGFSVKPVTIPPIGIASVSKRISTSKTGTCPPIPPIQLVLPSASNSGSITGQRQSSRISNSSNPVQPIKIPQISSVSGRQVSSMASGIQAMKIPQGTATTSSRKPPPNTATSCHIPPIKIPIIVTARNSSAHN